MEKGERRTGLSFSRTESKGIIIIKFLCPRVYKAIPKEMFYFLSLKRKKF